VPATQTWPIAFEYIERSTPLIWLLLLWWQT
jgi:hypothetical protein